ncbi:MAG: phosphatidylserine decarboxylase [Chromatiales bacterium]
MLPCDASFRKGEQMGWFQHGSTIFVFATDGFKPCEHVKEGTVIRTGQPLLRLPERQDASGLVSLSKICSPGKRSGGMSHSSNPVA